MNPKPNHRHRAAWSPTFRALLATTAVGFFAVFGVDPARGFSLEVHAQITRSALQGSAGDETIASVLGEFFSLTPTGNLGSDRYQDNPGRHYDNAVNAVDVCYRWALGQNGLLQQAIQLSEPGSDPLRALLPGRQAALSAFGMALHALQDFYSHSNWVELAVDGENRMPSPAPIIDHCASSELAGVHTGYFEASWANGLWFRGCPETGPPDAFAACHMTLAKDHPHKAHGEDGVVLTGEPATTYHAIARRLAIEASQDLWLEFRRRIVSRYTPSTWDVDGECIFRKLAFNSNDACLALAGDWQLESVGRVRIDHVGDAVTADAIVPMSCPFGGTLVRILEGVFTGATLGGRYSACQVKKEFVECGLGPIATGAFTAEINHSPGLRGVRLAIENPWVTWYRDAQGNVQCEYLGPSTLYLSLVR